MDNTVLRKGLRLAVSLALLAAGTGALALSAAGQNAGAPYVMAIGFPDMPVHGPQAALGMILWNPEANGRDPTNQQPPPIGLRYLVARGWDFLSMNRNPAMERFSQTQRHIDNLVAEINSSNQIGYKNVIAAGQGYGGAMALSAAARTAVFGVIGMTPAQGAPDQLPQVIHSEVAAVQARRQFYVLPADDPTLGGADVGGQVRQQLAPSGVPFVIVDRQAHGAYGGYTQDFMPFGNCASWFFTPGLAIHAGEYNCFADTMLPVATVLGLNLQNVPRGWVGYLDDSGQPVVLLEHPGSGASTVDIGIGGSHYGLDKPQVGRGIPARWNGNVLRFAFSATAVAELISQPDTHLWRLTITDGAQKHWNWAAWMGKVGN